MNIHSSWNDQTNREPILKIWREIKAREQMEEESSPLHEESSIDTKQEETLN